MNKKSLSKMAREWLVEKAYGRIKQCPICDSSEGFWLNYGMSYSYIQCKNCGTKTQLYQTSSLDAKPAEKTAENWKSTIGFTIGAAGLIVFAFGLVLGIIEEFPFAWLATAILGISIFAAGLTLTVLAEPTRKTASEETVVTRLP